MSHQTGIQASDDLKRFLATAKNGNIRLIKIGITGESLELVEHKDEIGAWDGDYDECVLNSVVDNEPCYLFYRLDSTNNLGYEWLFIAYSPDTAEIRKKMLYAGTRSTMKLEFGGGLIKDELFATQVDEVSFKGYMNHLELSQTAAPLTQSEIDLKEVKVQHSSAIASGTNRLPGVNFPITDEALTALESIRNKDVTYVQLAVDINKEIIILKETANIDVSVLISKVPTDGARYHFFLFKHTHEGNNLESIVFISSMPGYSCPVKERMLYSSSRGPFLASCQQGLNMDICKKLEITEGSELTEAFLLDELHPQKDCGRAKFDKPKGPPGRGARRIMKKPEEN